MSVHAAIQWPNWVDVVVLTIIIRMSYNGSVRGFFTEILNLTGAVVITVFTVNYATTVSGLLRPSWWPWPRAAELLGFWGLFFILVLVAHLVVKRVAHAIRWERLHWLVQGMGVLLGGLRGVWWSGFLLITLASSGIAWLRQGVQERSLIGPSLLPVSRAVLEQVADRFPGASSRGSDLVPPLKAEAT